MSWEVPHRQRNSLRIKRVTKCLLVQEIQINKNMLITIAVILLILWFLGVVGVYTIGWFIHILLVLAIIVFLVRIIQGRNPLE